MRSLFRLVVTAAVIVGGMSLATSSAYAATPAASPDHICAPTADPCVIDQAYDVTPPGSLDFGLRTVHMTGPGALLNGSADILCGAFLVDSGGNNIVVDVQQAGSPGGTFTVTARRACSGDGTTPCLGDASCATLGLGICSVGDGTISLDGEIQGNGDPGGTVMLRAAGDITIANTVRLNGSDFETNGGFLEVESFMGSITTTGKLKVNSGAGNYSFGTQAGEITLTAAGDVTIAQQVELMGGSNGGFLTVEADSDITVRDDVLAQSGQLVYAAGGYVTLFAGADLLISEPDGSGDTLINTDGGSGPYGGYGGIQLTPGYAGDISFDAGADITIHDRTVISGRGGFGGCYGESLGANFYMYAENGKATLDGKIQVHGRGTCGQLGRLYVYTHDGIDVGKKALLTVKAKNAGYVRLLAEAGPVNVRGTIDAEGKLKSGGSYYTYYGYGGPIEIDGTDVTLDGAKLLSGADGGSGAIEIEACRLHMKNKARIDHTHGAGLGYMFNEYNSITVGESMIMEAGSKLLADATSDAENEITYRDPNKPPVLDGDIDPPPRLSVNPSLAGCPVCGNSEIDQGESCDDGNTVSGDFCNSACQDEGCIADTPGYPTTALCDDGDACTLDVCDPVSHECLNPISCEEGVACTVDACVAGACEHTPDDSLCDDDNDCTDDVCNVATGCVYASLTGNPCEDGDLCTVTGDCVSGNCVAGDESLTENNKIIASLKTGPDNDRLKVKLEMPDAEFGADPVITGMIMQLFDADDQPVFEATLEATSWEDQTGAGTRFRFRDTQGPTGPANGVSSVKVSQKASTGVWKVSAKMRDTEIPGAAGQSTMSLSLLFGTDPAVDDCLTARRIPCVAKTTKTTCK